MTALGVEVAPGVRVRTSRRMSTTSTALVDTHTRRALLVDPAWLPDELAALAGGIAAADLEVVGGFATHAHHDHLLWHPGFGPAPRWASARTAELAVSERDGLVAGLGRFPAELVDLMGRVTAIDAGWSGPDEFEIEPIVHNGHAPGHTALWLPQPRVLLAGDMLSDLELPLPFGPDDVPSYLAALDVLAPYAARAAIVIPGHGSVGDDAAGRLDADRRYLDDMLTSGRSDDPRRAHPGMAAAYADMVRLARGDA